MRSKMIVKYDKYDKLIWSKVKDKIVSNLPEEVEEAIFYLFYKYNVEILEENEVIEKIRKSRKFEYIKSLTTLDEDLSLLATQHFCSNIDSKDVEEIMNEIETLISSTYGSGLGEKLFLNPKKKVELYEKLLKNKKLLKLMEFFSRFNRLAIKKSRRKIKAISGAKHSVKFGNKLNNLLTSELKNLADEYLYLDFLRRYAESKLLNYEILEDSKDIENLTICLDVSGSMRGAKEEWAKAIALALTNLACSEEKKVNIILFDDDVREIIEIKKITMNDIIYISSVFYGGGTNFEKPLKKALDYRGDIIFITDGEAEVSTKFLREFLEVKNKESIKVFSFCINTKPTLSLKNISDVVMTIYELNEKSAETLLDKVI